MVIDTPSASAAMLTVIVTGSLIATSPAEPWERVLNSTFTEPTVPVLKNSGVFKLILSPSPSLGKLKANFVGASLLSGRPIYSVSPILRARPFCIPDREAPEVNDT